MADIKSATQLAELQDFLDSLPKKPCSEYPGHSDYCTVCKRLNREVASVCKYSGLEIDAEKASETSEPEKVEFKPISDEVETTQVIPSESEEDFPMIEIVKPTTKPRKPVEMELLEDVAIEFEIMGEGDEPVEVEVLEVEPLEEDEFGEGDEEGDVLQFEAVDGEVAEVVEVAEIDESSEVIFEPADTSPGAPPMLQQPAPQAPVPIGRGAKRHPMPKKPVMLKRRSVVKKVPLKKHPGKASVVTPRVQPETQAPLKLEPVEEQGFGPEPTPAYSTAPRTSPKVKLRPRVKLKPKAKLKNK